MVGRKTQNLDIRRRENDVQPYQVSTRPQIVNAHRNDLEQYFRSRVTANTQINPPSLGQTGETNSLIDLRGLGTDQTLILVDGRRLPGLPQEPLYFQQPDLNAIPLHAIERVETLTGTAGGIYGFGALGGVVNVILRRDYHGLELHGTTGISARGDARRFGIEGGIGFSPDDGGTDVMLYVMQSWEQSLLEGQRGYQLRGRELARKYKPSEVYDSFISLQSNAINVFDYLGNDLVLKPEYGGGALGARYTFLPRGFSGSAGGLAAALTRNAGQLDLSLSDEANASDLGSTPTRTSAIFNLRHRFSGGIEAYFDGLILRNRGRFRGYTSDGEEILYPDDPRNPFENMITATFPALAAQQDARIEYSSNRFTAGLIAALPRDWKATGEITFGTTMSRWEGGTAGYFSHVAGLEGTSFNPFDDWEKFRRDLANEVLSTFGKRTAHNRYREQSLRLAGPVFRTAAGMTTLSLLAQNRTEKMLPYSRFGIATLYDPPEYQIDYAARTGGTRSLHAEIDAPLIADTAKLPLLRGLTLQLAVRHDEQSVRFYSDPSKATPENRVRRRFAGTTFTAGAKFLPLPWLMLRGSYATGQQPPKLSDLIEYTIPGSRYTLSDPKRANSWFSDGGDYDYKLSGSPTLEPIRASTLALGVVFNPSGEGAPRISIDFSRIRRSGDPVALDQYYVLAHEDLWPERVVREPLTDADRALGYTGGPITLIDARKINGGTFESESIDGKFEWILPFAGGTLRSYAATTWQLHNIVGKPDAAPEEFAGYSGGPLRWRANGGLDWTIGRTMLGANLQYFSRYRVESSTLTIECGCSAGAAELQGSQYIKSQAYLDLYASRRFRVTWGGKERELSLDLGLVNLFDAAPPYVGRYWLLGQMFSPYGDPRRRRFELGFNANF